MQEQSPSTSRRPDRLFCVGRGTAAFPVCDLPRIAGRSCSSFLTSWQRSNGMANQWHRWRRRVRSSRAAESEPGPALVRQGQVRVKPGRRNRQGRLTIRGKFRWPMSSRSVRTKRTFGTCHQARQFRAACYSFPTPSPILRWLPSQITLQAWPKCRR